MSETKHLDFIRQIVADDVSSGKDGGHVATRFPPEPNGFLHIGHASAICLDFGVAAEYSGHTTLRMDDTNPTTEDPAYVEAIARDIAWLGFEWDGEIRYASDYFEPLFRMALRMVEDDFAYVDSLSEEEIRAHRGSVKEPGRPSPYRDRSIDENLELFQAMRAGEFEDGTHVLRAKIDLSAPNMKMRDPLMYRIRHAHHYRTGDSWPIYPFYDWAHGQSDGIEGITHSLCTLEFQNNRELYDWFIGHTRPGVAEIENIPGAEGGGSEELGSWTPRPRQYEFARRNLDYTIVSKRELLSLVEDGSVSGWDDPRMPTLAGLRRRGAPPEAIRAFCEQIGIGTADNRVDVGTLEWAIRETLNARAPRVMCVLDPLKIVITNYPDDAIDWLEAPYFPRDVKEPPEAWPAARRIPFSANLYIERDDFEEDPEPGFKRLAPGREVRLRHGFFITCDDVIKDEAGAIVELRCTYDPETTGGSAPDGRKPSGTIHWVSADASLPAEVRLYDRLFNVADPHEGVEDFRDNLNPDSLDTREAFIEPSVAEDPPETAYQFERVGYFVRDRATRAVAKIAGSNDSETRDEPGAKLVFNRTVALRDSWSRATVNRRSAGSGDTGASTDVRAAVDHVSAGAANAGTSTDVRTAVDRGDAKMRATVIAAVEIVVPGEDTGRQARDRAREATPALQAAFERLRDELDLSDEVADLLSASEGSLDFYERAIAGGTNPAAVANWLLNKVRGARPDDGSESALEPEALGSLVQLVENGTISVTIGNDLLVRLIANGGDPREIVDGEELGRLVDTAQISEVVDKIVADHPDEADRYRAGQAGLAGFFVGQVMRATKNRADAALVRKIVEESLQ